MFRILAVHNRYLVTGGEDKSYMAEVALLRQHGHHVDEYVQDNQRVAELGTLRTAVRTIWSQETYHDIQQRLQQNRHDLVYVQNFFPLISPSLYYAAQSCHVPVIQTLRNYRLLCANALFLRDQNVCEDCLGKFVTLPAIKHACYRDSRAATATVVTMLTVHRLLRTWSKTISTYVALTEFARQKFIQGGLPAEKIVVKPNFLDPDPGLGTATGNYALFIGRLSEEKGIDVMLQAWEGMHGRLPLKIIGDGPLRPLVQHATKSMEHVHWLGSLHHNIVMAHLKEATLLVFPSICYEGLPRTIIEAYAVGVPVIASNHGSMSTLVHHNRTGRHFIPGDHDDLQRQLDWMLDHPDRYASMRQSAREKYETEFSAIQNYQMIADIFQNTLNTYPK